MDDFRANLHDLITVIDGLEFMKFSGQNRSKSRDMSDFCTYASDYLTTAFANKEK